MSSDDQVLDALADLGPTVLWWDLARRTRLPRWRLRWALRRLAASGRVVPRGTLLRAVVPWRLP